MSIPGTLTPLFNSGAAEEGGYLIERSLRFNSADSAYLSRTPSVSGNRKTWTWAGWVKLSSLATANTLLCTADGSANNGIYFTYNLTGALNIGDWSTSYVWQLTTTALFRDFSAWYHVVAAVDTTQATASNRVRLYVNGIAQSSFGTSNYPSLNYDTQVNETTKLHVIGRFGSFNGGYHDGYLADIHFIDGQALDPTSFGLFDSNGIWQPKAYTGTYGTNGFHLEFADNSNNTATTLGKDTSPNGNNWTPVNLSVIQGNGTYLGTITASSGSVYNAIGSFNGVLGPSYSSGATGDTLTSAGASRVLTWTPPAPISATTLRLWGAFGTTAFVTNEVSINGGPFQYGGSTWIESDWFDLTAQITGGVVSSIAVRTTRNSSAAFGPFFAKAVEINGLVLIDYVAPTLSGNDSLVDVPTNGAETDTGAGGEVRGNYCTWNPLSVIIANGAELSNGNLDAKLANARAFGTVAIPRSGKWYFEVTVNSIFNVSGFVNGGTIGLAKVGTSIWSGVNVENGVANDGGIWKNSALVQLLKNATAGDVYGIAYNADTLSLQIYRNGSSYGNSITLDDADYIATLSGNGNDLTNANNHTANFGQRPFATQAPSGFKALCTANLP